MLRGICQKLALCDTRIIFAIRRATGCSFGAIANIVAANRSHILQVYGLTYHSLGLESDQFAVVIGTIPDLKNSQVIICGGTIQFITALYAEGSRSVFRNFDRTHGQNRSRGLGIAGIDAEPVVNVGR